MSEPFSPAFEAKLQREERIAERRRPRRRVRTQPCVIPDCRNESRRSSEFPLCVNHLVLVWREVSGPLVVNHGEKRSVESRWVPGEGFVTDPPRPDEALNEDELEARRLAKRERARRVAARQGTLYVLDAQNETVKIGWTSRELWQRLDQYPPHFRLIVSVPGTMADERDVHRSLAEFRAAKREWYHVTGEVVRQINDWIAIANTIEAQRATDNERQLAYMNPDVDFSPTFLPRFTTLAAWAHDGRVGPYYREPKPAPKSKVYGSRVG